MKKVTEVQILSQNRPVLFLMIAILLPVLILILVKVSGESANEDDFFGLIFTIIIMAGTFLVIFRMKTVVVLSPTKLEYKDFPFKGSLSSIATEDIASVGITNHKWYHGYGYRYGLNGVRVFAMKPGKVLKVITQSGKNYQFGINRVPLVKRFITEEWSNIPLHVD